MKEGDFSQRVIDYPIADIFWKRWSPRAMSGEVTEEELRTLFEAARWAPSSYNEQPWRILYAKKDTEHWNLFFDLLVESNQQWATHASHLLLLISKKTFTRNSKPNTVHMFDAGSAWENMALQASEMNIVCHGMGGFDYEKARTVLAIPEDFTICAMVALGKPAEKETLPENFQGGEVPSGRKQVHEFVEEGQFNQTLK